MIALYSRVSTAEQAAEGYSIGEQKERLTAYCKARGWTGFKHFIDAGFSGGDLNRPAMQDMIKAIQAGAIGRVVVYKLDRLSRSQKDTLYLLEDIFAPHGVDFVSMSENFDTGSPFGKATIGLFSVFAQLERDTIRERVTLGRTARAKEGKYHGGSTPPVGYDYIDGRLIINDFEAMQVRECFNLFLTGSTYTEIAETLNGKGWTHKNGRWIIQRVRSVLQNPVYVGMIKYGGEVYAGIHEPIIDRDAFEATAAIIQKAKKNTGHKKKLPDCAYLIGKIYCARCGARYTHSRRVSGHKKDGPKLSYYICSARNHPKQTGYKCDNTIHRADNIDGIIFDSLRGLKLSDVARYRRQEPDTSKALQDEIKKIDRQRSRLIDLFSVGTFEAEELTAKLEPLNAKKKAIEEHLAAHARPIEEISTAINSIAGVLDAGGAAQKRALINTLVDRVEIDGDNVTIFWDFE